MRQHHGLGDAIVETELGANRMTQHGGDAGPGKVGPLAAENGSKRQFATHGGIVEQRAVRKVRCEQAQGMHQKRIGQRIARPGDEAFQSQRERVQACACH